MKVLAWLLASILSSTPMIAQGPDATPISRSRHVTPTLAVKIFNPSGAIRIEAWDRDSLVVHGHVSVADRFFLAGDSANIKFGVEERTPGTQPHPAELVVYLPRRGTVSIKSVDASITGINTGGWFYTVSGAIRLSGAVASAEAESMSGDIDLDLTTPWIRAHTGRGRLFVRGAPQDVDASTVGGTLDVSTPAIMRGRFASVTGDIDYTAAMANGALFEFSNHSGAVSFAVPRTVSATLDLSSVTGSIDNGFTQIRPIASASHALRLRLGGGDAQIVVRTFKGAIRVRPQ